MTLDEYLTTAPAHEPPVVEAVLAYLGAFPDVHIEPVSVGILVKAQRSFVELRPMVRWEALWIRLPRREESARIARRFPSSGSGTWHVLNLREPSEVDAQVRDWLTEAYLHAAG